MCYSRICRRDKWLRFYGMVIRWVAFGFCSTFIYRGTPQETQSGIPCSKVEIAEEEMVVLELVRQV